MAIRKTLGSVLAGVLGNRFHRTNKMCVCVCISKEIYYKELADTIWSLGKSQDL